MSHADTQESPYAWTRLAVALVLMTIAALLLLLLGRGGGQ